MNIQEIVTEQARLQEAMGWPMGQGLHAYENNLLAMSLELSEVAMELDWKPWKDRVVDQANLATELADALQFWANATMDLATVEMNHGIMDQRVDGLTESPLPLRNKATGLPPKGIQLSIVSSLQREAGKLIDLGKRVGAGNLEFDVVHRHRGILTRWGATASALGVCQEELEHRLLAKWRVCYERLQDG
ncbi:MAG TPA: dUTP diphosphatase [Gammaproteobacteria bacterium]|nr:dUTP diphosphatase [Gammaproteobacteria bacterium]